MIITIARQCGSGGHEIGKELASRLGLELYDRKKLEEEAKKLGKLDENKEFFQEKAVNSLLYSIAVSYGESNPMEKSFELIRELTQQKPAVIIGRCSGAIYANDPEATTVFLHADKDCRIKRVMERDGINEKKAAKLIKEWMRKEHLSTNSAQAKNGKTPASISCLLIQANLIFPMQQT